MSSVHSSARFECRLNFKASCRAVHGQSSQRLADALGHDVRNTEASSSLELGSPAHNLNDLADAILHIWRQGFGRIRAQLWDANAVGDHLEGTGLHKAHAVQEVLRR